jgi:Holliday junction resolvase RusA-like endonuclease
VHEALKGVEAIIPGNRRRTELHFSVPLVPPSVNHYKQPNGRGGYFVTKEAKSFIDAVCMIGKTKAVQLPIPGKFYEVILLVHVQEKRFLRGDSDNMEKVAFDAISKHAGIVRDDRYITRHTHRRIPVPFAAQERTEYTIIGREEP